MRKAFSVLVLAVAGLMVFPTASVNALFVNVENTYLNSVLDTFSSIRTPDPNKDSDYWWRILNTAIAVAGRVENQDCAGGVNGDSNCVVAMSEGWNDFARFRLRPGKPAGEFYLAQITDVHDSVQGIPLRWEAKPDKPVIMTARVRFSENYSAVDGNGANGTAGFGFWNNPTENLTEPPFFVLNPVNAIFFSYSEANVPAGFSGYSANYVDHASGQFLPYFTELSSHNMHDWAVHTIIWSIDSGGNDNMKYYIGATKVAEFTSANPLAAMNFIAWVDSSFVDPTNPVGVTISPPDAEQNMDIDFISIVQPGT